MASVAAGEAVAVELQAPTTIAAAIARAPKRRVPFSNVVSPLVCGAMGNNLLPVQMRWSSRSFNAVFVVR
jgi:hypothetical protein